MTTDDVVQLLVDFDAEPPNSVIDRILDAGSDRGDLRRLVAALGASSHTWAVRLVAFAVVRAVRSDEFLGGPDATPLVFDLARVVVSVDDSAAAQSSLTAMTWLAEHETLDPRDESDRQSVYDLVSGSLSIQDPNRASAALGFLRSLVDFGRPIDLFGVDRLETLRAGARSLIGAAPSRHQEAELAQLVELLDSLLGG